MLGDSGELRVSRRSEKRQCQCRENIWWIVVTGRYFFRHMLMLIQMPSAFLWYYMVLEKAKMNNGFDVEFELLAIWHLLWWCQSTDKPEWRKCQFDDFHVNECIGRLADLLHNFGGAFNYRTKSARKQYTLEIRSHYWQIYSLSDILFFLYFSWFGCTADTF